MKTPQEAAREYAHDHIAERCKSTNCKEFDCRPFDRNVAGYHTRCRARYQEYRDGFLAGDAFAALPILPMTAPKNTTDERISRIRLSGISYSEIPELSTITAPSLRHLHPKCSRILSEVSTSDSIGQLCTTLSPPQSTVPASTGKTLFFAP